MFPGVKIISITLVYTTDILFVFFKNSLMDSVGEREGGKIWENGVETCKISCMKRVASPGSMHDTGCLGLVTGTTQRDGMGRERGGGFKKK